MTRVDLDSPEHALCSAALERREEERQVLKYQLGREKEEVTRAQERAEKAEARVAELEAALHAWDALYVWEPFEGYEEEMALHFAFHSKATDSVSDVDDTLKGVESEPCAGIAQNPESTSSCSGPESSSHGSEASPSQATASPSRDSRSVLSIGRARATQADPSTTPTPPTSGPCLAPTEPRPSDPLPDHENDGTEHCRKCGVSLRDAHPLRCSEKRPNEAKEPGFRCHDACTYRWVLKINGLGQEERCNRCGNLRTPEARPGVLLDSGAYITAEEIEEIRRKCTDKATPVDREALVEKLSAVERMMKDYASEVANWKRRALAAEADLDRTETALPAPEKLAEYLQMYAEDAQAFDMAAYETLQNAATLLVNHAADEKSPAKESRGEDR